MVGPASSTTTKIYLQSREQTAVSPAPQPKKARGQFVDNIPSLNIRVLKIFSITSTIFIKRLSLI